jgi:acyl-CoA thioesterase-1
MLRRTFLTLALLAISACSVRDAACGRPADTTTSTAPAPVDAPPAVSSNDPASGSVVIAFLGDSLTAGYGLLSDQAFPALLEQQFAAEGYSVESINAGISGDTTAGGLRRVGQVLGGAHVLVVALGGNDALRGLTTRQTQENLSQIIEQALAKNVQVLLCGMEALTNYGEDYRDSFRQVYINLLRQYQGRIGFLPFLLEGVAGNPALNQSDGIHPNVEGSKIVATVVYPRLRDLVDRVG